MTKSLVYFFYFLWRFETRDPEHVRDNHSNLLIFSDIEKPTDITDIKVIPTDISNLAYMLYLPIKMMKFLSFGERGIGL